MSIQSLFNRHRHKTAQLRKNIFYICFILGLYNWYVNKGLLRNCNRIKMITYVFLNYVRTIYPLLY